MKSYSILQQKNQARLDIFRISLIFVAFLPICFSLVTKEVLVYDGSISGEIGTHFERWHWNCAFDEGNQEYLQPKSNYTLKIDYDSYGGFYFHGRMNTNDLYKLRFSVYGGENGGQFIAITIRDKEKPIGKVVNISDFFPTHEIPAFEWNEVVIPFEKFGVPRGIEFYGFTFQSYAPFPQSIYFDSIYLMGDYHNPKNVKVLVDLETDRKPMSPFIFGVNEGQEENMNTKLYTINRWGGDTSSRYAWDVDAVNLGQHWYYMTYANPLLKEHEAQLPHNSKADQFINYTISSGAKVLLTVSTLGFVPIDRKLRWAFSQDKYGPQEYGEPWHWDAGNGIDLEGELITNNDYRDSSRKVDANYIVDWLRHIRKHFGFDAVQFFSLDNEPGLWSLNHRDVHPEKVTYEEMWNYTVVYGTAIKEFMPTAKIFGPVVWGWCETMFSPADGCYDGPDKKAHDNMPFLEWFIYKLAEHRNRTGILLVDYIDVHYYPEEQDIPFNEGDDLSTAEFRFNSLRSLYDRTYLEPSWINNYLYFIPRIKEYIDKYFHGDQKGMLKLSISEYNFGGEDSISSAIAQVDVFHIFAREGVDVAARWGKKGVGHPSSNSRIEQAFQIFSNYDSMGSKVRGDYLSTSCSDKDVITFSVHNRVQGQLFVFLIHKNPFGVSYASVDVSRAIRHGNALVYAFSGSHPLQLMKAIHFEDGYITVQLEPWSVSLVAINLIERRTNDEH